MKQGWNIFSRIVGTIIVALIAAVMLLESPKVQKMIAAKATEALNSQFGATVSFTDLRVRPFNIISVDDLLLLDKDPYTEDRYGRGWAPADTFLYAKRVRATVSVAGLLKGDGIHIKRAMLERADFHIVTEPDREHSDNLSRIFGGKGAPDIPQGGPNVFDVREIDIRDFRFRLTNFRPRISRIPKFAMDFDDLDVRCERVLAHSLKLTGGRISFTLDDMDLHEKSGYDAWNLRGKARVGMGRTDVYDFHLDDPWSDFDFHEYSMTYKNARAFQDFVDNVVLEVRLKECRLGMMTLSHFVDIIPDNNLYLDIKEGSHAKGTINDLGVTSLAFTEVTSGVGADLSAHIKGLTDKNITLIQTDIRRLGFTTLSLEKCLRAIDPSIRPELSGIAPGVPFTFKGSSEGPLCRVDIKGKLRSRLGEVDAEGRISNIGTKGSPVSISATAATRKLDIGKIISDVPLGECTMEARGSVELAKNDFSGSLESLFVDRINVLGYDYSNIYGSGSVSKDSSEVKLTVDDAHLNFTAEGSAGYSKGAGLSIKAIANLAYADLDAMHLDPLNKSSRVSCSLSADISSNEENGANGEIKFKDIILEDEYGLRNAGDIILDSKTADGLNRTSLSSKFLDILYSGTIPFDYLVPRIENITSRRHLPALYSSESVEKPVPEGGEASLALDFHDTRNILSFVLPGLYISDSTKVNAGIDPEGRLTGALSSQRIAYGKNYIKDADLTFDNLDSSLNVTLTGSQIKAGLLSLKDAAVSAYARDNSSAFSVHITDADNEKNYGEFYLNADFARAQGDTLLIHARPMSSYLKLSDSQWQTTETDIYYRKGSFKIGDFSISNGPQSITMSGGASSETSDTLSLSVHALDLGISRAFTSILSNVKGNVNGDFILESPLKNGVNLMADLSLSELFVGSEELGEIRVVGAWDDINSRFNAFLANNLETKTPMSASGWFRPSDSSIDVSARMDGFKLACASPFVSSIFSEIGGCINGRINISGPLSSPEISSEALSLDGARLKVAFTGVPYNIDGPLTLDSNGVRFASATIRDDNGGFGSLAGGLDFENLHNIRLNARISAENLEAVNLEDNAPGNIHGHLLANADLNVSGPFNDITITGSASTADRGELGIILGKAVATADNTLLSFKEPERIPDPFDEILANTPQKKKNNSNINLKIHAGIGSGTRAKIDLNKDSGNAVTAIGSGIVDLDFETSTGRMNLAGDYTLTGGKYHFEIPGVLGKDFNIRSGSSLKFAGDLMDTDVNLDAVYNLKTSLSSLLSDTSSVSSRRNVECLINISGRLRNPEIQFGINIPDLDPSTKSRVQAALNTEDKIQQQFVSLLVIGSFLPGEQSGVFNSGNVFYSNFGSIMSNQLNNILQQLEIPLDLDLGYQQMESGTDIFDVAVSTQLFNNRVEVAGSVGNRKYRSSATAQGDVVGDVDIEYKIDPAGAFRLKAFSHSADEFSSFLDYSQRNGVGVSFQKGFDDFRQFFRDIFSPKKDREEDAARREEERRKMKTVTLDE